MKNQGIGARAFKNSILAALLLASLNTAHAGIHLSIEFDSETNLTTLTGVGSIEASSSFAFEREVDATGFNAKSIGPDSFAYVNGPVAHYVGVDTWVATGDVMPNHIWDTASGDYFAFDQNFVDIPAGFGGGDLNFFLTSVGNPMGLTNTVTSGAWNAGSATVSWSAVAVPEPMCFSVVLGVAAVSWCSRRRGIK